MNNVSLVGRLTRDPERRYTPKGTPVTTFRLAINTRVGEDERVDYFDITSFAGTADAVANHMAKGRLVGVTGALRQDRWQDKETGQPRSRVVVRARNVQFLDRRNPAGDPDAELVGDETGEPVEFELIQGQAEATDEAF